MIRKTPRWHRIARLPLAAAVAASVSAPVSAFQFFWDDLEGTLDTSLSAGAAWRVEDRDQRQLAQGNLGPEYAYKSKGASTNNYDDGNWNFDKGETYTKRVKGTTELLLSYENYGGFIRGKYWYDFELKDEHMAIDDVGQQRHLNERADGNASGVELMDAYVWGDFEFGETPVSLRVGNQVVSWGESTFILNGVSVVNPIDVSAIRAPGAELKEALIPVNMVYTSIGLTEDVSLEAYVQLEWEKTRPDDCGTFFSTNDFGADGCGPVLLAGQLPDGQAAAQNFAANRLNDGDADDTDQFGLALRWYAPELNDTEFGFYFMQYHNRLPVISGVVNNLAEGDLFPEYRIVYPENIKNYGISFNTSTESGWSVSGEYTFKQDVPLQWNAFELIYGGLGSNASLLFQDRVLANGGDAESLYGTEINGYDRFDISQVQTTLIKFYDQVLGASRLTFLAEVGATYVHGLLSKDVMRLGRAGTYGIADFGSVDRTGEPFSLLGNPVSCDGSVEGTGAANINSTNCEVKGFTTAFSWGYRARFVLDYNDVFAGVNLKPVIAWSHDVKGYGPEPAPNFLEGRKALGLTLNANYLNQYTASIGYSAFFGGGKYNLTNDRDNVSLSVGYSF